MQQNHLAWIWIMGWSASLAFAGPTEGPFSAEGTNTGGGGGAIVCRAPNGEIKKAEWLDLFEGTTDHGLTLVRSDLPYEKQIQTALQRLEVYKRVPSYSLIVKNLEHIKNNLIEIPIAKSLVPRGDARPRFLTLEANCRLEQMATYTMDGKVWFDRSLYDAFSQTDIAAFYIHEALYKIHRDVLGVKNSDVTRELTALLFATSSPQNEKRIQKLVGILFDQPQTPLTNIHRPAHRPDASYVFQMNDSSLLNESAPIELRVRLKNSATPSGKRPYADYRYSGPIVEDSKGKKTSEEIERGSLKVGENGIFVYNHGRSLQGSFVVEAGFPKESISGGLEVEAFQNGIPLPGAKVNYAFDYKEFIKLGIEQFYTVIRIFIYFK